MADHPFNGPWTSYAVSWLTGEAYEDGRIELDIAPNGTFNSGRHVVNSGTNHLLCTYLSATKIELVETAEPFCRYTGWIVTRPSAVPRICAGIYKTPDDLKSRQRPQKKPRIRTQEEGTWVGTQP